MSVAGRSVIIVGGASGLGAACVALFARAGAQCLAIDRDGEGLRRIAAGLAGVEIREGDATDPALAEAVAARDCDILIHTAGIDPLSATDVVGTSPADWAAVLAVNLTSAFLLARAVLPGMIRRKGGCLLFTGSVAGLRPTAGEAAYAVSKAGVIQLARAIALDHARDGIRANALCPGVLEAVMGDRRAAMTAPEIAARHARAAAAVPAGREGRYAEMARLALMLCDEETSGYVTGQAIVADGGLLLV
jgi:NAD(P)-dependent dehydrogenase (short-subunit alcohol dehydrogenase family)